MPRPRIYDWDEIRRLHHEEGLNAYQVAKRIGCDTQLCYYVLKSDDPPHYYRPDYRYRTLVAYREKHRRPRKPYPYTREQVVEMVREFIEWNERLPRRRDWGQDGLPPYAAVAKLCGGSCKAIEAAGYKWHRLPMIRRGPGVKPKREPCAYPNCHKKGVYQFSDFSANEAQVLCQEHYRLRLAVLGGVVH